MCLWEVGDLQLQTNLITQAHRGEGDLELQTEHRKHPSHSKDADSLPIHSLTSSTVYESTEPTDLWRGTKCDEDQSWDGGMKIKVQRIDLDMTQFLND